MKDTPTQAKASLPPESPEAATGWDRRACFRMLALLWVLPDLGAVTILLTSEMSWIPGESWGKLWERIAIEQWVALGILLLHGYFIRQGIRPPDHPSPRTPSAETDPMD